MNTLVSVYRAASSRAWLTLGLLWVAYFLNYFDRMMLVTMRTSILEAIPMSDAQFGSLTTVFLFSYAFVSPLMGYLADRLGRSRVIICSVLIWSAATWLTSYAQTYPQMLAFRVLMGVSEAAFLPAAGALIIQYHGNATQSLATGIAMSGLFSGLAAGGLGGLLAEHFNWRFPFMLFGWFGIGYALLLMFLLRDSRATDGNTATATAVLPVRAVETLRTLFGLPSFWLMVLFFGLIGLIFWPIYAWMPTFIEEQIHLRQGTAGILTTACINGAGFVGMLCSGILGDRWSQTNPRARIHLITLGLVLAAPAVLLVSRSALMFMAVAGLVWLGLSRGLIDPHVTPLIGRVVGKRHMATAMGFLNLSSCLAGGAMIYIGGALRDAQVSLHVVFGAVAVGFLIAAFVVRSIRSDESVS